MRKVNMPQCITGSIDSYIQTALDLINDTKELARLRAQLSDIDLQALLIDNDEPQYFANAIDYLITHHSELKGGRNPIILA
jgi:predicted O-linked N-acetylglucosamine transferase (SPINDLY family)